MKFNIKRYFEEYYLGDLISIKTLKRIEKIKNDSFIQMLDIDGVMVSGSPWKTPDILEDGFYKFIPNSVKALQKILKKTNANIVIVSSHSNRYTNNQWIEILNLRDIYSDVKTINTKHTKRIDIIIQWTQNNKETNYVIIDDDSQLSDLPQNIKNKLVLTKSLIGLTLNDADVAISILNEK
jgi:hypothetical protein